MNSIAIIIVTYNRKELLRECLDALLQQTYNNFDIILIDNNSTDGTGEMIKDYQKNEKIKYYNTYKNIGGAGGFNYGLKLAMQQKYEYFWLLDDDAIPYKNALEKAYEIALQHPDFGFISSNVLWIDNNPCLMNKVRFYKNSDNVYIGTFVGFLTRREVVLKVGFPIKEFFIWADDTNYSLRINKNYKSYYAKDSILIHKMGVNVTANIFKDNSGRYERYFYAYRNRKVNVRIEHKRIRYFLGIIKNTFKILFKSKNKGSKLKYMYKGFFKGFSFRPKIEYYEEGIDYEAKNDQFSQAQ